MYRLAMILCICASMLLNGWTTPTRFFSLVGALAGTDLADIDVDISTPTREPPAPEPRTKPKDDALRFIYENGMEYVYENISQSDRENVDAMMKAMSERQEYCELVHSVSEDTIWEYVHFVHDYICGWAHVDLYNFEYYDDGSGNVYAIVLHYLDGITDAMNSALQHEVDRIVAESPKDSEAEQIKYFHDYICNTCEYSYTGISTGTAYGALLDKRAVCQGYAHAMQMLLSRAGYDCVTVIGLMGDMYHKWNYVKLSDGSWRAIDVTWDDPDGLDEPRYDYYLLTDDEMEPDHGERYGSWYFEMPTAD